MTDFDESKSTDLTLGSGWRIGEEAFANIVKDLMESHASTIVEFGSGVSTIRLARALPHAQILSLENSRDHYRQVVKLAEQFNLAPPRLEISYRPMTWQLHAGALYQSYAPGPFPELVDAAIIDGPPAWTRRGREACLHMIAKSLRVGGQVFLDDYCRSAEKQIVENWHRSYPGVFTQRVAKVDHEVCVLTKTRETSGPRRAVSVLADSVAQNSRRAASVVRQRLTGQRKLDG